MSIYIRETPGSSSPTAYRTCLPPSTSSPCFSRARKIFPPLVFFPINMQGEMSASLVSPRSPTFLSGQRLGVVDTEDIVDQHLHSFDVTNPLPIMEHILRWRDVWESPCMVVISSTDADCMYYLLTWLARTHHPRPHTWGWLASRLLCSFDIRFSSETSTTKPA